MKRVLIIATALSLAAASSAVAQEHDHGGHPAPAQGHPSGGHPPGAQPANGGFHGGPPAGRPQGYPGGLQGAPPQGGFRAPSQAGEIRPQGAQPGFVQPNRQGLGGPYRGPQGGDYHGGYGGQPGYRGGQNVYGGGYGRGGPGFRGPGQFSYRGRTFSSFRAAPFQYPPGFGYRRWYVGAYLPGLFLGQSYFIGDWDDYDLGPPPPGEHWVRYGPDALLVNNYTGEVDDVVYGVFY